MAKKKKVLVVLTKDVSNLGKEGDLIGVRPGYFRNNLFPKNLAVLATEEAKKQGEKIREKRKKREAKILEKLKAEINKLKDIVLEFKVKVKDEKPEELYGSISSKDIVDQLIEKKVDVKQEWIIMAKDHIKKLGEYEILVRPKQGVEAKIKVLVEKE